jgi:hypothetical protein
MRSTRLWPNVSPNPDAGSRGIAAGDEAEIVAALLELNVIVEPDRRDQRNVFYSQKRGM